MFILLLMIFLHIVDDYYLQGLLIKLKQKSYWEENAPEKMYKYDYIWALIMHGFSWTFMIMLPLAYIRAFDINITFLILFAVNLLTHSITDHVKANKRKINLIEDQVIHVLQILITFCILR